MSVIERILYLLTGSFIGFVLGYIVRYLQEIEDDLHIKHGHSGPKDRGAINNDLINRIALLVVVVLTAFAAFKSQQASNRSEESQERLGRVTICTQQYLQKTITALNERTTYTQAQANANVDLQKAQAQFLALIFKRPPLPADESLQAAQKYFNALTDFLSASAKTSNKVDQFPFPTNEELQDCLDKR